MANDLVTPDWLGYIPRAMSTADLLGQNWAGYPSASPAPIKVQPSFGTSGIPRPTVISPPTTGANTGWPTWPSAGGTTAPSGSAASTASGPFTTLSNVKNPAIDQRLTDILKTFDTVRAASPDEFVNRLRASMPQFNEFTQSDIGTLGDITGPGLETKLADLRSARRTAIRSASDRALSDLTRILSAGRSASSAGPAVGGSGFLTALGLDKASQIEQAAALDEAQQGRGDLEYLTGQRVGAIGKRGDLLQADVNRSLLPSQANSQWFQQLVQSLLPIVSASGANNFYGIRGPGDFVGDSYGGIQAARLNDLSRIDAANNNAIKNALASRQLDQSASNTAFDNQLAAEQADNQNALRQQELNNQKFRNYVGLG